MTTYQLPAQKKLRLVIYGHVQGVSFRYAMRGEAKKLGVSGWVRNRSDGSVEAAVHGDSAAVDALVVWAQRGPELARVERVDIAPDDGSYNGFEIIS
jgi:acylphosphatase